MPRKRKPKATHRIYFKDEVAKIGCGFRCVTLTHLGRKWVKFFETGSGIAVRVTLAKWNSLERYTMDGERDIDVKIEKQARTRKRKLRKEGGE